MHPIRVSPLSIRAIPAVYAAGLNFRSHAREVGFEDMIGKHPVFTMKGRNSVITSSSQKPPKAPQGSVPEARCPLESSRVGIVIPKHLQTPPEVDYEGELAVIIGKQCKNVPVDKVKDVVAGVTCAVDVTARRWQGKKGGGQWSYSKSFDTFCPLGPHLVELSQLEDIKQLSISTTLNGEIVQNAPLSDMVFDVPTLVSFLTRGVTLEPGTVILCGTPAGVGYRRMPDPYYLKHGDILDVTITQVGTLKCTVQFEA